MLKDMLATWRTDGLGPDVLQVWLVSYPGEEALVAGFCAGTDASCFVDGNASGDSAFTLFSASKDDLLTLDDTNATHDRISLATAPLTTPANRAALDAEVRGLLE